MFTPRYQKGLFFVRLSIAFSILLFCGSCGDDSIASSRGFGAGPGGGGRRPHAKKAGADQAEEEKEPEMGVIAFTDDDFLESEKNRDPFRSYFDLFQAEEPAEIQRKVVMPRTNVESMKLIAIITGVPQPKAMLYGGDRVGHVVERGVYLGAPEIVQASENVAMTLNWRVHRIRDNEVVLIREDPTDPTRPALTKVIPLREKDEIELQSI